MATLPVGEAEKWVYLGDHVLCENLGIQLLTREKRRWILGHLSAPATNDYVHLLSIHYYLLPAYTGILFTVAFLQWQNT
jgi:hypothetical protein